MEDGSDLPTFRAGEGLAMDFDGNSISYRLDSPDLFRAKITGATGSAPIAYSWVELADTAAGTGWEAKPSGRSGTTTSSPAFELNNVSVPPNSIVFMREKCLASGASDSVVYEFAYGSPGTSVSATVVTSIQCTGNQLIVGYDEIGG